MYVHFILYHCIITKMSSWSHEPVTFMVSSFQFEIETEGGKLGTTVLAEGNVGSGGASSEIVSDGLKKF